MSEDKLICARYFDTLSNIIFVMVKGKWIAEVKKKCQRMEDI